MRKIYSFIMKLLEKISVYRNKKREIKKINEKKRIEIQNLVTLTKDQSEETNKFFKKYYGKKVPLNWHKNYYSISGNFDCKYIPEHIYTAELEKIFNSPDYYKCLQDKNITNLIINGLDFVKTPDVIIKCSINIFIDEKFNKISFEEAINTLNNRRFFIKPSVDSCSGHGCRICDIKDGIDINTNESLKDIIKKYQPNFIAQEIVKNCKDLYDLHPNSLNTFRVITYILNDRIYHCPVLLRIGTQNNYLDNAHAGGIFVGINEDGYLLEYAHSEFGGSYSKHPDTHITFKNHKIVGYSKVIEAAHRLQALFPQVRCINWDLTLDENENVVLIENNMRYGSIWLPQMAHGIGPFGENTQEILTLIRKNKILYK